MNLSARCQGVIRPGLLLWLGIGATGFSTGCSDGGSLFEAHPGPGTPAGVVERDTLVVGFAAGVDFDTLAVELVGGQSGRILHRLAIDATLPDETEESRFRFLQGAALDRERSVLLAVITPSLPDLKEIIALGLPDMDLLWRARVRDIAVEAEPGVDLAPARLLGIDRAGRWLFLRAARGEQEHGVLVVGRDTRQPVTFLGDFVTTEGTMIVRVAEVEAGEGGDALLVVAGRRSPEAVRLMLYEAGDFALRDSVFLEAPFAGRPRRQVIVEVQPAGDGRHVYAVTQDSVFKVDVRALEIVARAQRRRPFNFTQVAVSTDPTRLFLTDGGAPGALTGSGQLEVRDGDLGFLKDVDLRSEVTGVFNNVPNLVDLAVGRWGNLLFLVSGSGSGGFNLVGQEATLSVVDVVELTLLDTKRIGGFGVTAVFAF